MSDHPLQSGEKPASLDTAVEHTAALDRKGAERKLLWKIDLLLMPLLTITLGLQYYDKAALGSAAAFGIIKDLVGRFTDSHA